MASTRVKNKTEKKKIYLTQRHRAKRVKKMDFIKQVFIMLFFSDISASLAQRA